jgi:hypothetical protein
MPGITVSRMDDMNSSIAASWRRTTGVRFAETVVVFGIVIRARFYQIARNGTPAGFMEQGNKKCRLTRKEEKWSLVLNKHG